MNPREKKAWLAELKRMEEDHKALMLHDHQRPKSDTWTSSGYTSTTIRPRCPICESTLPWYDPCPTCSPPPPEPVEKQPTMWDEPEFVPSPKPKPKPKVRAGPPRARLNAEKVIAIRKRMARGEPVKSIATDYSVALKTIYDIRQRRTWAHVE